MISIKSVKSYCSEDPSLIENYEEAINSPKMYDCHHRLEIDEDQEITFSSKELIDLGYYYHRPAKELIFLEHSYHTFLHSLYRTEEVKIKIRESQKGKHLSEEHKRKIGESHKGKQLSSEHKRKIGESRKGKQLSSEHKRKIGESQKGKHHSEETKRKICEAQKGKQLSSEHKRKIGESCKGRKWYNNGAISVMAFECPEGFVQGRLKKEAI